MGKSCAPPPRIQKVVNEGSGNEWPGELEGDKLRLNNTSSNNLGGSIGGDQLQIDRAPRGIGSTTENEIVTFTSRFERYLEFETVEANRPFSRGRYEQ
jgi:hypothetical protein